MSLCMCPTALKDSSKQFLPFYPLINTPLLYPSAALLWFFPTHSLWSPSLSSIVLIVVTFPRLLYPLLLTSVFTYALVFLYLQLLLPCPPAAPLLQRCTFGLFTLPSHQQAQTPFSTAVPATTHPTIWWGKWIKLVISYIYFIYNYISAVRT